MIINEIIAKHGPTPPVYLTPDKIFNFYKNYKPNMTVEYGKYYLLDSNKYYFCPDIGRKVKFMGNVAIKCGSSFGHDSFFGNLIDTSNPDGPDYETNTDIEFRKNDVISEYEMRDMPIIFTDFNQK